jgi:hypothetical protein
MIFREESAVDSLQFLNCSLAKLVENLSSHGVEKFKMIHRFIDSDKINLALRKGVYSYDYMTSEELFAETKLPAKEIFYSNLTEQDISHEDYAHAQNVWQTFAIENMGEYHDLYLKLDVLQLTDVFEHFRTITLQYYKLDPAHFYTSPGLAWQACLKMSNVSLELLTDPDMHLFIENSIRGGISMISNRYSKANNKYMPDYDPCKESKYIMYLDMNNLYGWAMCQSLPTHDFRWLSQNEIEVIDVNALSDTGEYGYILECDLIYPQSLHNIHSCYRICPQRLTV